MLSLVLEQTWAVLIGASIFPRDEKNLPPLPSVKNNINDLAQILEEAMNLMLFVQQLQIK